jgi:hypothetical protein
MAASAGASSGPTPTNVPRRKSTAAGHGVSNSRSAAKNGTPPLRGIDVRDRTAVIDRLDALVIAGQLDVDDAAELAFVSGSFAGLLGGPR